MRHNRKPTSLNNNIWVISLLNVPNDCGCCGKGYMDTYGMMAISIIYLHNFLAQSAGVHTKIIGGFWDDAKKKKRN